MNIVGYCCCIYHPRHGSAAGTLSRTGRQFVDGYFYVIGSKRLCEDGGVVGSNEGTLGVCWTMAKFTAIAEGRSAERGEARRAKAVYASTVPADCGTLIVAWCRWLDDDRSRSSWRHQPRRYWFVGSVRARLESQILLHYRWPGF